MGMDIAEDLEKLASMKNRCQQNVQIFLDEIGKMKNEKKDLYQLTKEENEYENDALIDNMSHIDDGIARLQVAIEKERQYSIEIDRMITVLEEKRDGGAV